VGLCRLEAEARVVVGVPEDDDCGRSAGSGPLERRLDEGAPDAVPLVSRKDGHGTEGEGLARGRALDLHRAQEEVPHDLSCGLGHQRDHSGFTPQGVDEVGLAGLPEGCHFNGPHSREVAWVFVTNARFTHGGQSMGAQPRGAMTQAVLFDVFGTLIRFSAGRRPFTSAMRELGFDRDQKLAARALLMTTTLPTLAETVEALETLAPGRRLSERSRELAADELAAHQAGCDLVEGALDLVDALRQRGTRVALVSNLSTLYVPLIKRLGLHERVDHALYSCEVGLQKPDPAIFQLALEALGSEPGQAIMVGDSLPSDVRGAAAAGIHAIWISPGGAEGHVPCVATLAEAGALLTAP